MKSFLIISLLLSCNIIYGQVYKYKAFESMVSASNDQTINEKDWKKTDILFVLDLNKNKLKTYGAKKDSDIDLIGTDSTQESSEATCYVYLGIDKEGEKCKVALIIYKEKTNQHIATLILDYFEQKKEVGFRLKEDN